MHPDFIFSACIKVRGCLLIPSQKRGIYLNFYALLDFLKKIEIETHKVNLLDKKHLVCFNHNNLLINRE